MSESKETVEQAAKRLGLKIHRSVNYPREAGVTVERVDAAPAIEIIQSLEAEVAKLKAALENAKEGLKTACDHSLGSREWYRTAMLRYLSDCGDALAKHQGGGDE